MIIKCKNCLKHALFYKHVYKGLQLDNYKIKEVQYYCKNHNNQGQPMDKLTRQEQYFTFGD